MPICKCNVPIVHTLHSLAMLRDLVHCTGFDFGQREEDNYFLQVRAVQAGPS